MGLSQALGIADPRVSFLVVCWFSAAGFWYLEVFFEFRLLFCSTQLTAAISVLYSWMET